MTSQHIKHHKLQKLLRPSGIVFLINITAEEKEAGIDNVSTVSYPSLQKHFDDFQTLNMLRRNQTSAKWRSAEALLSHSQEALLPQRRHQGLCKVLPAMVTQARLRHEIHTYDTRSRGPRVRRTPTASARSPCAFHWPKRSLSLPTCHGSTIHFSPFRANMVREQWRLWIYEYMNIWIYEYMNIWINNYDIVQALKTSHPLWSVIHWGTDMECMFLLIGAHQHVQVKAFRLALATSKSGAPFFHSNHSQPEELQQLGEWAPDTTRNSANSANSHPTSKPVAPQNQLCFTVVQNP